MLNSVNISGRLVKDPELRQTSNGVSVASFRIACDRDYKEQDGSKAADFFTVTAWRAKAEFVSKYFKKGHLVTVSGRLKNRSWTDNNGEKKSATDIEANEVYFGESRPQGAEANNVSAETTTAEAVADDDFPF